MRRVRTGLLPVGLAVGLVAGLAGGCSLLEATEAPRAEVEAWVEAPKVGSGEPVRLVVSETPAPGWSISSAPPVAEGMETAEGRAPAAGAGEELVVYELSGPDGSYTVELPPVVLTGPEGQQETLELGPFFVDVGVAGPTGGPLAELEPAQPEPGPPWAWIALALLGLALLVGLVAAWLLRKPEEAPAPPPLSPAQEAAQDWARARAAGLADHPLAVELSRIFRVYLERSSGWPATRRTGLEILDWIRDTNRLGPADQARAARILQATDRLKFAREGGGAAFFDGLDGDFEGVLTADRLSTIPTPAVWNDEVPFPSDGRVVAVVHPPASGAPADPPEAARGPARDGEEG